MYPPQMPTYYPPPMGYGMMTNPYQQELEELHQKLTKQIEYNEKRRAKRKNKKRVKKQRNSAASKIQLWWKKWSILQKWRDPLSSLNIQRLLMNNELANAYLDDLINEYFRSEFIPDLLIEILTTKDDDEFYQKDVISQIAWSFYESIELEVCHKIANDIANDAIHELVYKYFKLNESNGLHLKSILIHIQNELIEEVILAQTKIAVEQSIEELIIHYLIECKAMELYNEILPEIIEDDVDSSVNEYILETDVIDGFFFDKFLNEWVKEIVSMEYEKYKQKISDEKKAKEFDLIESCLVKSLLNEEMLNILIDKLSTRSQKSFIDKQSIALFVNGEMSKMLISKHMDLYETHGRTKQNIILNESLMKILCDTSIAPFIDFLKDE